MRGRVRWKLYKRAPSCTRVNEVILTSKCSTAAAWRAGRRWKVGPTLNLRLDVNGLISDRADCSELLGHAGPLRAGTASRPVRVI